MKFAICSAALAASLLSACAAGPSNDGPLLADGEKRECRTGTSICRKPDPNAISDVRTVSGDAVRDAGTGGRAAKPTPGQQ